MQWVSEKLDIDIHMLIAIIVLVGLGTVAIYSSSCVIATEVIKVSSPNYFFLRHLKGLALGALLLVFFLRLNERTLRWFARPIMIVTIILLILLLVPNPLRVCERGSYRWLELPFVRFQPSEVAKASLVVYLADYAARKGKLIKDLKKGFLPALIVIVTISGLIALEPNISTAAMVGLIGLVTLYAGGARLSNLIPASCILGCILAAGLIITGYNADRFDWRKSYQVTQAKVAIGSGGIIGTGIGEGNQKYGFVPDAHTDFSFAIFAEETGFVGAISIVSFFLIFVYRGLKIASRATTIFSSVLATGLTFGIGAYFCLNILVCTGCIPTAGLPMPFISYGGTSSMMLLASCGMILGVARRSRRQWIYRPADSGV
ncbi:MAG: FtsW/RodA/SpoVE family cell cycle protein [bacterium]